MNALHELKFKNHPILGNLTLNFTDENGHTYKNIILVGENGCGKTTILNEINNYARSNFIIDKHSQDIISEMVSQDIKYQEVIKVIRTSIDGAFSQLYGQLTHPINESLVELDHGNIDNQSNPTGNSISVACPPFSLKKISDLNNSRIYNILQKGIGLRDLLYNAVGKVKIDAERNDTNYVDNFCSGEQELLLKIVYIATLISKSTNVVLLDEPETALHPRWQLKIVKVFQSILSDIIKNDDWQLFIATHSENILSSVINDPNTLIIRLYKDKNKIKASYITNMGRRLPLISFAEIQYIVFGICTNDYHNQLFGLLANKLGYASIKRIDDYIVNSNFYDSQLNKHYNYRGRDYYTLPVYIRNAIHHPEDSTLHFKENDLKNSIEILRDIIKNLP